MYFSDLSHFILFYFPEPFPDYYIHISYFFLFFCDPVSSVQCLPEFDVTEYLLYCSCCRFVTFFHIFLRPEALELDLEVVSHE
jgi:hypothetical protein